MKVILNKKEQEAPKFPVMGGYFEYIRKNALSENRVVRSINVDGRFLTLSLEEELKAKASDSFNKIEAETDTKENMIKTTIDNCRLMLGEIQTKGAVAAKLFYKGGHPRQILSVVEGIFGDFNLFLSAVNSAYIIFNLKPESVSVDGVDFNVLTSKFKSLVEKVNNEMKKGDNIAVGDIFISDLLDTLTVYDRFVKGLSAKIA